MAALTGPKEYCPAISFDDKYLFSAEDGKPYRYENREQDEKKLIYPEQRNIEVTIDDQGMANLAVTHDARYPSGLTVRIQAE